MTSDEKLLVVQTYGRAGWNERNGCWELGSPGMRIVGLSYHSVASIHRHVKRMMWVKVLEIEDGRFD